MPAAKFFWPPHDEYITKAWLEGRSATEIMMNLNGGDPSMPPSRNAVIGRLHRMGVTGAKAMERRANPKTAKASPPRRFEPKPMATKAPKPVLKPASTPDAAFTPPDAERVEVAVVFPTLTMVAPVPDDAVGVALMELKAGACKWPIGKDPGRFEMHRQRFCGEAAHPGAVYCVGHCRRAYNGFQALSVEERRAAQREGQRKRDADRAAARRAEQLAGLSVRRTTHVTGFR